MNSSSRIFVTGGRGLVGSAVRRQLTERGYTHVLAPTREELDLMDGPAVKRFYETEEPEYVIHAAARAGGIKASAKYSAEFLHENLTIQNHVIWNAYESGVKKLLFLGSSCIYPGEVPQPMKEEYLLTGPFERTNEGYSLAKVSGLKLCQYLFEQYGKEFISCMPCNLYGEGDYFDHERGHVIASLILRMHEAKVHGTAEVAVWGTGNARREFLYVDDAADAFLFLLEHYHEKQFINIGSGEDISIKDLALLIKKIVGYEGELFFDAAKPEGVARKLLEVSKMRALGWKPRVSFEEGLKRTYANFLAMQ